MTTIELTAHPEVRRVILAAFPSYKKHHAFLSEFGPSGHGINSYWDGGSRSEYAIVHLPTLQRKALPTQSHPYFDVARAGMANAENQDLAVDHVGNVTLKHLPVDFALIQGGTFCGKTATAHVMVNPANMTKLLPVPTESAERSL